MKIIFNAAIHLSNMIEDALDLSRLENNKFDLHLEFFNLSKIIQEVTEVMRFQIEQKKLNLYTVISPIVPKMVLSDPKRYKQVLFNLIGNAIKFTLTGYIKVNIFCKDKFLITEVEDTGVGIKEEDL